MDYEKIAAATAKEDAALQRRSATTASIPARQATNINVPVGKDITVKNRAPSAVQITAEQLLHESSIFAETAIEAPSQTIQDESELLDYKLRKRKEFEGKIRLNPHGLGGYLTYAAWEASLREFARARSIFERALAQDYRTPSIWIRYLDVEQSNGFIAHARNLYERAITLLPRIDTFWYKYLYMEELIGDVNAVRVIFKRWLDLHPDRKAWQAAINFELRQNEPENARELYRRMIIEFPDSLTYKKFALFEEKRRHDPSMARAVYDCAIRDLQEIEPSSMEKILSLYAQFETRQREFDRARAIYRYALTTVNAENHERLYDEYISFEKMHADSDSLQRVLVGKRKFIYEREIAADQYNYDSWMDSIQLLTGSIYSSNSTLQNDPLISVDKTNLIQLYEKSIATVPTTTSKPAWKRYVYLWLRYAYHMELNEKNIGQARAIYEKCIQLIPHERFSFRKLWIAWAEFEIRAGSISNARNVLGHAIGLVPHPKLFTYYADLEMQLGEIDRVRKIYEKWLECSGGDQAEVWCIYTDLEERMEEIERMRALYEMALTRPSMDRPELIWKAYIDAEKRYEQREDSPTVVLSIRVCNLYDRLLTESGHARAFISFAEYEVSRKQWERGRAVYDRGDTYFRHAMVTCSDEDRAELAQQRYTVLNEWLHYEQRYGTEKDQAHVQARMPTIVTKKREIGVGVLEDYNEYLFPEQQAAQSLAKARMLELAKKWRAEQMQKSAGHG